GDDLAGQRAHRAAALHLVDEGRLRRALPRVVRVAAVAAVPTVPTVPTVAALAVHGVAAEAVEGVGGVADPLLGGVEGVAAVGVAHADRGLAAQGVVGGAGEARAPLGARVEADLADDV